MSAAEPERRREERPGRGVRGLVKVALSLTERDQPVCGAALLIYHRVGAGTRDELDVPRTAFRRHLDLLEGHDVVSLDDALDRLDAGDDRPGVVLTFDDGFEDVFINAWPLLRERRLPFTIYLASGFVSKPMVWPSSTAQGPRGRGMSWAQLEEMLESGLCTVGNHTHDHVRPEKLTEHQLDACTAALEDNLGVTPRHFTYPWGVPVPTLEPAMRARFRSASTGHLGRNGPETDRMRLRRLPVRRTDPDRFFASKLNGGLRAERSYAALVRLGKGLGLRG